MCPRSDTDKQNDGIGLTQTRPRVFVSGVLGIDSRVHTRSGLGRMDAITALASWPNNRRNSPRCGRSGFAADGGGNSPGCPCDWRWRCTSHWRRRPSESQTETACYLRILLLGTMVQEESDRGPVVPKKVVSYWINALGGRAGHHRFIGHFEPLRPCIFQKTYEDDTRQMGDRLNCRRRARRST